MIVHLLEGHELLLPFVALVLHFCLMIPHLKPPLRQLLAHPQLSFEIRQSLRRVIISFKAILSGDEAIHRDVVGDSVRLKPVQVTTRQLPDQLLSKLLLPVLLILTSLLIDDIEHVFNMFDHIINDQPPFSHELPRKSLNFAIHVIQVQFAHSAAPFGCVQVHLRGRSSKVAVVGDQMYLLRHGQRIARRILNI